MNPGIDYRLELAKKVSFGFLAPRVSELSAVVVEQHAV
jgi:hypothetical protein